jgi:flagellar biosynthesis GTPase FlhF
MESIEQSVEQTAAAQLEMVLEALNEFGCADLFVVVKAATQALEKATKLIAKAAPKAGSAPKGVQPPQLARPRAWVEATLEHALAHGWEKFVARKGAEEIEYPASVEHEGAWIFPGSVDAKNPNGKQILMTHAMSLSKQRWSVKAGKGTHQELYEQFLANTEAASASSAASSESSAASSESSSRSASPKAIIRKTAAEKAAELAEAKRVKEEEKATAKAAKDAEKAEAKRVKELEKAEEKRVKDEAKAAAKAAKEAEKPAKSPKAAVVKAVVVKALVKAAVKPVLAAWSCPTDGSVRPWLSNGVKYLRNSDNQVWLDGGDELGAWQGVVDVATGKIDTSVAEPSFDDEE